MIAKSKLIHSKYCKECYDTIKLAEDLSLQRCANCHEFFNPSESTDPHHCPKCLKKMRRCRNCHKEFIPQGKIILCPVCYSNIVKTCRNCKEDFIPKSKSHTLCSKCLKKKEYQQKAKISKRVEPQKNKKSDDRTFELLIKALDDSNTREYAKDKLIECEKDSVKFIIQSMHSKNKQKRRVLVGILVDIGKNAVDDLIGALNDDDYFIRKYSAKALGLIGDERSVEPLISALDDFDSFVRRSSAKALGLIGDGKAINPLIELLENDSNTTVQIATAAALGNFNDENAIEVLIETLDDDNPNLVIQCLKSLIEIDEGVGINYLTENVYNSKKEISDFSKNVLISFKGEDYLKQIKPKVKVETESLSKEKFLEYINNLSDVDPDIRMETVKILGDAKIDIAAKYLVKLIDDDDGDVRLEVLKTLGKLKNPDTLDALLHTLTDDDTAVRWAAEEAIANFGSEAIQNISKSLLTDDDNLRYYLVAILGEINDEKAEMLLIQSLEDPDLDVKIKTIESLAHIGSSESISHLLTFLNDDDKKVKRACSYALGKICQEEDLTFLEYTLKNDYEGENQQLESLIKKIKIKLEKNKNVKSKETQQDVQKPDLSPILDDTEQNVPNIISPEDETEDVVDTELEEDPFAILDEISKKQ